LGLEVTPFEKVSPLPFRGDTFWKGVTSAV